MSVDRLNYENRSRRLSRTRTGEHSSSVVSQNQIKNSEDVGMFRFDRGLDIFFF